MKRLLILFSFLCFVGAKAQTSVVSGTVVDPLGNIWSKATVTATFAPTPGVPGPYSYQDGSTFNQQPAVITTDNAGSFMITLPDNNLISPSGSTWKINVCPNSTISCVYTNVPLTNDINISSILLAAMTDNKVTPLAVPFAYSETMLPSVPRRSGAEYYDVNLQCLKVFTGIAWTCVGGNTYMLPQDLTLNSLTASTVNVSGSLTYKLLNGKTVNVDSYPGDLGARLTTALSQNPGEHTFIVNTGGDLNVGVGFGDSQNVIFNDSIREIAGGALVVTTNSTTVCANGVNIYGLGKDITGPLITAYGGGAHLDTGAGCTFHDAYYGVVYTNNPTTGAVNDSSVHNTVMYNVNLGIFVAGSDEDLATSINQPNNVKVYENFIYNSKGGVSTSNSHNTRVYSNVFRNIYGQGSYGFVGFGKTTNTGAYLPPTGSLSQIYAYNNSCDGAFACEFTTAGIDIHLGKGSYATNIGDVAFDLENTITGVIDGATCGTANNACASSFFNANDVTIQNVTSSQSAILIKNSSGDPSQVNNIKILNNNVPSILTESASDLTVQRNFGNLYALGFSSNLILTDNKCVRNPTNTDATPCYNVGSPFYGGLAQIRNNSGYLLNTNNKVAPLFNLSSGYYNAPTVIELEGNFNSGFSKFAQSNTGQPNPVPATYIYNFNHEAGGTVTNVDLPGNQSPGVIIRNSYYDVNEKLVIPAIPSSYLNTDGTGGTCGAASLVYKNITVVNNATGVNSTIKVLTCP